MAMAAAVKTPVRMSFALEVRSSPSTSLGSWGFSSDGTILSMTAMTSIPAKNAAAAAQPLPSAPSGAASMPRAAGKISTMDT